MEAFFAPATAPFAIAICLMGLIALVEIAGALLGLAPSGFIDNLLPDLEADAEFDLDADTSPLNADVAAAPEAPGAGPLSQVLGWLCVGRVPILVLLIVFLTAFGLTGFMLQGAVATVFSNPAPAWLAVWPALAAALPATRYCGLALARIMPKEQTEAVSRAGFVGRIATIIRGEARRGLPAEAKLADAYGQTHYLLVEPDDDGARLAAGEEVLIVRQTGGRYRAIPNPNPVLTDRTP